MDGNPLNPLPGVSESIGGGTVDPRTQIAEVQTQAVAVTVPSNEVRTGKPHERALIQKWLQQARVPQWLQDGYNQWDKDRKYLHTDLFASKDPNVMSVNLATRAIQAKTLKITPSNADLSVTHRRGVGSVRDVREDAIRRAKAAFDASGIPVQAPALMMAAERAEQDYRQDLRARERFCQTGEALGKLLWDDAHGTSASQTFATEGMTVGMAWMKIGWQRDFGRDSIGRSRYDDMQDQLALLSFRAAEYAAGMFGKDDSRYGELMALSDYARFIGSKVTSGEVEPGSIPFANWEGIADSRDQEPVPSQWLPEPEVWQGAVVDGVRPEAMRWDWTVPFSRWQDSSWVMEQNLMHRDDVAARYGLTPAEAARLGSRDPNVSGGLDQSRQSAASTSESADPDRGTYEDQVQRGQIVVWERWDRSLRRHCIFVEGLDRMLVDEVPRLVGPRFYPYVAIAFNVMDGKHLPISDTFFMRKIQDAINQRLTDAEESLWASMSRYLVKKNSFKDGEMEKLRGARPHDVIEVESPEEITKTFHEIASDDWKPEKYNLDQLFRLFELVSGMSISELGVTGQADFATEAAIANNASQANTGRHAQVMAKAITEAMTIILHYAASSLSDKTVKDLVGMAAFWPQAPSRMDLLRSLSFKVNAAGSTKAAKDQAGTQVRETIAALNSVVDLRAKVLAQGGTFDADPINAAIFRTLDTDTPVREMISFPASAPASIPSLGPQTLGQQEPAGGGPATPMSRQLLQSPAIPDGN